MNCRECKYVCRCCDSNRGLNCSGCENQYDEFSLNREFVNYCPIDGTIKAEDDIMVFEIGKCYEHTN